jgi:hypothetical protein
MNLLLYRIKEEYMMGMIVIIAIIAVLLLALFLLTASAPVPEKSIIPAPGDKVIVYQEYDQIPLQAEIIEFLQDDPTRLWVKWYLIKVPIYKKGMLAGYGKFKHPFEFFYDRYQSCGKVAQPA